MATGDLKIALNSLILILENSIDEFPRGQLSPELLRQAKTDNFSVLKVNIRFYDHNTIKRLADDANPRSNCVFSCKERSQTINC